MPQAFKTGYKLDPTYLSKMLFYKDLVIFAGGNNYDLTSQQALQTYKLFRNLPILYGNIGQVGTNASKFIHPDYKLSALDLSGSVNTTSKV